MTVTGCPSAQELLAFQVGDLEETGIARVADHLERCSRCQSAAQKLDGSTDSVLAALQELAQPATANTPPAARSVAAEQRLQTLMTRLGQLQASAPADSLPAAEVDSLAFLTPPDHPDELGWLGQYRVRRVLGQGGMGLVFQAEDTALQRAVALKVLRPHLVPELEARQRFLREARAMAAVKNEHIVAVYQVGQVNDIPFLAMELLDGVSLEQWLEQGHRPGTGQLLRLGREIAAGLAAAHAVGLVHRDIKPANIWLEQHDPGVRRRETGQAWAKILDFGLACAAVQDVRLTGKGFVLGTPAYMAPEQAGGAAVDARADLFSLGCVLYRLATGCLPFPGENALAILTALAATQPQPVGERVPGLPPALAALIMRLLEKLPADRPPSALAVIETIQRIEQGRSNLPTEAIALSRLPNADAARPIHPAPTVAAPLAIPVAPQRRRRRPLVLAGGAAGVVLALGVAAYLLNQNGEGNGRGSQARSTATATLPAAPRPNAAEEADWLRTAAALAPKAQLEAVRQRLMQRNPQFDGEISTKFFGEQVVGVTFNSEFVTDLTPLRALTQLQELNVSASRIAPSALVDLAPLAKLPLKELRCSYTKVSDLTPLRDMPLTRLELEGTAVRELRQLAPIRQLDYLDFSSTAVTDLGPIEDLPLRVLRFNFTRVEDLRPVKKMPLKHLSCTATPVADLSPLIGKQLDYLQCVGATIGDFKPLTGMPLVFLAANLDPVRDQPVIQSLTMLKTLNGQPPEAFGKE